MDNKLKSSSEQIEFIVHAIRLTQTLRTSVCNLFSDIGDGLSDPVTSDTFEDASESEHQYHDQRHKAMLNSLRRSLETIGHNFGFEYKVFIEFCFQKSITLYFILFSFHFCFRYILCNHRLGLSRPLNIAF